MTTVEFFTRLAGIVKSYQTGLIDREEAELLLANAQALLADTSPQRTITPESVFDHLKVTAVKEEEEDEEEDEEDEDESYDSYEEEEEPEEEEPEESYTDEDDDDKEKSDDDKSEE